MTDLDAAEVRHWAAACVRTLDEHRAHIDGINVFPVADRDTGTNLLATMWAASDAVARLAREDNSDREAAWSALASGALAGARGNSGVILSQVLRGLAEVFGKAGAADARAALGRADELAGKAVSDPAPGTMLTVLHSAAVAAKAAKGGLVEVLAVAARVAGSELAGTTRQLDVLARAGVVDAGAQGLVLVLDELAALVTGVENGAGDGSAKGPNEGKTLVGTRQPRDAAALSTAREAGSPDYAYEVMYALADVDEAAANHLRGRLRRLGDCVSVVGDGAGRWAVHVHCNDVGAAIESGIELGRPHRIAVVRFDDQVAAPSRFARDRAVVVLARGAGIVELFRDEGASVLALPDTGPPDVAEVVAVIAGTQAASVTVLPNEPDLDAVLDAARTQVVQAGQDMLVVPTAAPVQGLAALAVHDNTRRATDDVVAMAEAAASTRRGELTIATEEAITWVGRCYPDDVLGLLDGEVVLIEPGPATEGAITNAAGLLLDRMLTYGGELVTVLPGHGAPADLVEVLTELTRVEHREVELVGYQGDQLTSVLMLGVE
ncbi:MAG TPA: DAK2 domain-containing protein [Pseudonocardiaceae bacterium]|nr:DAK2 domain-containing protein [Pseudonocardiaceae bacterium]